MDCTHKRPESLAAFLARIRPGDRCACCGATLQPLSKGPRMGRVGPGLANTGSEQAVMCPECGCEICEEASTDPEENVRELSPAA